MTATASPDLVDVAVVGSGCTGAMAAQTLLESGARVVMLDVGERNDRYQQAVPPKDFLTLRRTDGDQHRYFLGDDLEGIPRGGVSAGAQLTAPRQHILARVAELLPRLSGDFAPVESLAYGGLGAGWGLGCNVFSGPELAAAGLDAAAMTAAYELVSRRIGISGAPDDAAPYTCGTLGTLQPPLELDGNARTLQARYERRKQALNRRGFFLGRPSLALLTRDHDGRKATGYRDMDFYDDRDGSAFRPWIAVNKLRAHPAFEYRGGLLVTSFQDNAGGVEVRALDVHTRAPVLVRARRLVLAAGVLGTARIVLRSLAQDATVPVLCNPYHYVPCLQPRRLGAPADERRTSMAQLMLFHDQDQDNADVAQGSIYSYGSLLLFRLVSETPLDMVDARLVMRSLMPALTIVGIFQPEPADAAGRMRLAADPGSPTQDRLAIDYPISSDRRAHIEARVSRYVGALRRLGCWALRRLRPPMGSSIHYAGSLPFSYDERPLTLARNGRLHGTRAVWVADGSGFRFLPAKGLTFSLMANAHNVAGAVLRGG